MLNMIKEKVRWKPDMAIPIREHYVNQEMSWCAGDTLKNYLKQGNTDYSEDAISYKFNSHGYRCKEFDSFGPKLLSIGCSTIFGTGLPDHEISCEIVAQELGAINLNFGQPGGSNDYIARLLHVAVPIINPDYIIVNFTYNARREFITHSGDLVTYHPGMTERRSNTPEQRFCSRMLRDLSNKNEDLSNLHKNYCLVSKICEGRNWIFSEVGNKLSKYMREAIDLKRYIGTMRAHGPKARDGIHSGREANADMASSYLRHFV